MMAESNFVSREFGVSAVFHNVEAFLSSDNNASSQQTLSFNVV